LISKAARLSVKPQTIQWDPFQAEKAGYRHFMIKEIFEQPSTVRDTFRSRISLEDGRVDLEDILPSDIRQGHAENLFDRLRNVLPCGTGQPVLVGRNRRGPLRGEIASEFRYRVLPKSPGR